MKKNLQIFLKYDKSYYVIRANCTSKDFSSDVNAYIFVLYLSLRGFSKHYSLNADITMCYVMQTHA